ncbi:MAG: ribonuclease E inhibitor RraB [Lysobacteraceae bacterium]
MTNLITVWPDDADGDVFRRLFERGFDFSEPHSVDYNVDFSSWPPDKSAIELLRSQYGSITLYEPDEHGDGYVQFHIYAPLTYEGVITVQSTVNEAMKPYGGVCESWGVLQDAS